MFRRFAPVTHSEAGVGVCWAKIANSGEAPRVTNGDLIESRSIVEFTYDASRASGAGAAVQKRWEPLRVREDKTRLLRGGQRSRTANDFSVAASIWRVCACRDLYMYTRVRVVSFLHLCICEDTRTCKHTLSGKRVCTHERVCSGVGVWQ